MKSLTQIAVGTTTWPIVCTNWYVNTIVLVGENLADISEYQII